MPKAVKKAKFKTLIVSDPPGSGWHVLHVDAKTGEKFPKVEGSRRVICSINGNDGFQCALMPSGGRFYIMVSKEKRARFGVGSGDTVTVELIPDDSEFGAPMPEELKEVLNQDPEGQQFFDQLTAGKKRSIMYFVSKIKDIDKRIHTALIFIEHIKQNDGKIIQEKLTKELKRPLM